MTISRLSRTAGARPRWALALFAHNEAPRVRAALESIRRAAGGIDVEVWVLANGCTDATADAVRACADLLPHLSLVEIELADKANAWNTFVHEVITAERDAEVDTYFFMDGDVRLEDEALVVLAAGLSKTPAASAAAAMPKTGRDRDAWRARMVRTSTLAGGLYALRAQLVGDVRRRGIRLPLGLIGDDLLVSWLVTTSLGEARGNRESRTVFCPTAEFSFRSLSLARPGDYLLYLRRKWRYIQRGLQLEMLLQTLAGRGVEAMPATIDALYANGPLPSRLKWIGAETPLRLLAVLQIRRVRSSLRRHGR